MKLNFVETQLLKIIIKLRRKTNGLDILDFVLAACTCAAASLSAIYYLLRIERGF